MAGTDPLTIENSSKPIPKVLFARAIKFALVADVLAISGWLVAVSRVMSDVIPLLGLYTWILATVWWLPAMTFTYLGWRQGGKAPLRLLLAVILPAVSPFIIMALFGLL